jgi:hypothetical protein
MYKKLKIAIYVFILAISVQAENWYKHEYNASVTPGNSKPQWSCCGRPGKLSTISDGIYKYTVLPGKGWNHWQVSGPSFTIPKTAKGATIEFKVWAPKTQNRGMRLHIEDVKQCCWIMFLKNDGKEQILQIRSSKKDRILKLPNQFNIIRVVITRKNGRDKAAVFLNNSQKPVIKNWLGFGKKPNCAKIGFGAYNTKQESGTLLVDYVRWNPEQPVLPVKDNAKSLPMVRVPEITSQPVIDGALNDQCYKSLTPIKLYTWRKGKSKQPAPPVTLKICRDSKKLYFAFDCKEAGVPKVSKKLPRDNYIGKTDTLEIFLDPTLSRTQYYQIALNISNTLFDKFSQDGGWNGKIAHTVKVGANGWTAELAVDISSLDRTKRNPIWGVNFNYVDTATGSLMSWSPIKTGHHEPENFGLLVLDDKADASIFTAKIKKLQERIAESKKKYSNSSNSAQKQQLAELESNADLLASAAKNSSGADKILYLVKATSTLSNNITQFEKNCDRDLPLKIRKKLLANRPWCVVPVNSIIKPGVKYCPPLNIPEQINIFAAKGEFESYQLIVYNGKKEIKNGKITLSPLSGKSAKIPLSAMKIWQIDEVTLKKPSKLNPFTMPGDRVPDPLVHCNTSKIQIAKDNYKAFRVTVHVPRNLPAGFYTGDINFQVGNRSKKFPVKLKVWNFKLPIIPNLKTSFSVWDKKGIDVFHNAPRGSAKHQNIHTLYKNTLLKYRVTPRDFPHDFDPNNLDKYGKWLDEQRARGATIVYVPFKNPPPPYLAKLQNFLDKKGLLNITNTRSGDEPEPRHFKDLIKRTLPFKKQAPKIRNMVAGNNGFNELSEIIDAWCPLTNAYSLAWAEKQRKKSKQVWWYVCNVPYWPYANFLTDHKGIELRALLWQTYFYKADGLLYWNTTNWRFGHPRKNNMGWKGSNGDGILFYPGNNAPLPSLRLEILRDGIDDYDYLAILDKILKKNKGKIPSKLYSEAKSLLNIKALCGDLRNYSRDSEAYLKRREAIGNMIDKLQQYSK